MKHFSRFAVDDIVGFEEQGLTWLLNYSLSCKPLKDEHSLFMFDGTVGLVSRASWLCLGYYGVFLLETEWPSFELFPFGLPRIGSVGPKQC